MHQRIYLLKYVDNFHVNNFQPRPRDPIHPDFPGTVPDLWVHPDVPPNSVRGANAPGFVKS